MTSTAKVFEIIDEKIDVPDRTDALEMKIRGTVDFEDVSFGYDKASEVLRGIDLHIEPGEMIGIVGKSGVGKTTLINLLMRIYDVTGGSIKIDGHGTYAICRSSRCVLRSASFFRRRFSSPDRLRQYRVCEAGCVARRDNRRGEDIGRA